MPARFALLIFLAAFLPCAAAQPQEFAALLQQARARGCTDAPGSDAPLAPVPALDDAARRIARGEGGMEATRTAGWRAARVVHLGLRGYGSPAAAAAAIAERHCRMLVDPALTAVGVHRERNAWWVVLAAPLATLSVADAPQALARVLALTNEARATRRQCGTAQAGPAAPVRWSETLRRAAQDHADAMARHSFLGHEGRDGSDPGDRVARVGYRWRSVGENVASGQGSAEAVVAAWLRSPPHCATLMDPRFEEMGVAFAFDAASEGGIYWAQVFARPR